MCNTHFAISDTHISHANVLLHDGRPFATIGEHDATILQNCLDTMRPGSTLWHLGDVAMRPGPAVAFLEALRKHGVRVRLVYGNHDDELRKRIKRSPDLVEFAGDAAYIRQLGQKFYLHHYAGRVWRASNRGSYHLHGHSHGALPPYGRSMDVGVNCLGYKPISFEEVLCKLESMPYTDHH